MKRIVLGVLVAPLIWPWVEWPVVNYAYDLYTGSNTFWSVFSPQDVFHNMHMFRDAYIIMFTMFVPVIYICIRRGIHQLWFFMLTGFITGMFGTWIIALITSPVEFGKPFIQNPVVSILRILQEMGHFVIAQTVASLAMAILFWFIAVKGNPQFTKPPNHALNQDAQ